jgi:hypothetical protein
MSKAATWRCRTWTRCSPKRSAAHTRTGSTISARKIPRSFSHHAASPQAHAPLEKLGFVTAAHVPALATAREYDAPLLTMKPNKIIPTPMRNGCEGDEADIGNVCQSIGEENLVFSSDYPHSDSDFSKPPRSFFIKKCRRAIARRIVG